MLHHKSSPQATRSRAHTLAHSLHQLLAPLKLRHSHSHCVQYRYRDRDARFKCHTMPGLPCLALLLFLRAVLIRRILARIDARQQRPSARQPGVRPTPTIRTSLATLIARCWLAAQSATAVAVLPGSQPDSTLPRAFRLRSSCSRPPPRPRPCIIAIVAITTLEHRFFARCLTGKCRTRGRIWGMSTD